MCICFRVCLCMHVSAHAHPCFEVYLGFAGLVLRLRRCTETVLAFYNIFNNLFFILKALSSQRRILVGEGNVRNTSLATVLRMESRAVMVNSFSTQMPTLINW